MKLNAAVFALRAWIECRGKPDDWSGTQFYHGDHHIGRMYVETVACQRLALGGNHLAPCTDAPRRPEARQDNSQSIASDIEKWAGIVERLRRRMPRFDTTGVHVGIDEPQGSQQTRTQDAARG